MKTRQNSKIRVGIIGLGVGKKHILAFNKHPGCQVTALCDFSDSRLSDAAEFCPDVMLTEQADQVLDNPDIDLVSIASYDNYHYEQIVRALRNRKHIFVEKPLCLYSKQAFEIRKLLEKHPELRLSSNLNLRTCPRFVHMKEAVGTGEMGDIYYSEGDYLWGRISKLTEGWRKDMEFYSIVYGAAVHMIDIIIWMTDKKPVEVQGYGNAIASSGSDFKFNDFAVILMKFEDGSVAKVTGNGGCVHPHFHKLSIYGTKKTFSHNESGVKLWLGLDSGFESQQISEAYPANAEKGRVITSFVDSIIDPGKKAVVPDEDVFTTMSVCFAAEESIQKGQPVSVKYI